MGRHIEHKLLAPDGRPFLVLKTARVRSGETVQAFIRRNNWQFDLPTRCFVNGQVIRPGQLTKIRIRVRDEIVIMSRPGQSGSGGSSTAKTIGSVVALIALAVLAPWAGGAIAGAAGLAGATIAGVSYASIFSGVILAAGGMLLSQFMKPKASQSNTASSPIYSITASGNQAKPLGMIPVGYGQRLRYPEYGAPPYSTYVGDDQYLYQLFCIGCGIYDPKTLLLDDTPFWTEADGLNPAFSDVQTQWVRPGEQVTLFPVNITSATEVSGQQLPSPSKDPVRGGWLGPFSISPPDSKTKEVWLDYVWPSGAGATRKAKEYPVNSTILAEGRKIDGAGAPIGGESAPWVRLLEKTYSINKKTAFRVTEKVAVDGGRWQVRSRRGGDSYGDSNLDPDIQAHDDVSWTAARALLDGPQAFPGVTMLATVMKADAQLSGGSQNRIGVIACRQIEVYADGLWSMAPSRNPIDAAIDMWRNRDYAAGLSSANLLLLDLLYQRDAAAARGDTFDHFFEGSVSIQEAIETALRVCKSNPAFIGDRLSIVRDEPKAPRMLFTDQEIVRGSLSIKRTLLDDTWADGVVVSYFDERTNRAAEAASAQGLQRPARMELPGVSKPDKAVELARHLAAVNRYRRRRVSFQVELEGRMLKRGDLVLVQSELPQTWGQGGEIRTYLQVNGQYQITLDAPVTFTAGASHFVRFRRRDGRPYGPVLVSPGTGQQRSIALDVADLARVEAQQGHLATQVLQRAATEDPPSYAFSVGTPREYRGLVVAATMRDFIATLETCIEAPEVYAAIGGDVPPIPNVPIIFTDRTLPIIVRLTARAYQRGAGLFLSVSWDPVRNAALYLAQVSLDLGETWQEAFRDSFTTFEIPLAPVDRVFVRVACITASGVLCRAVQTECTVPALVIDGSLIDVVTLPPISYTGLTADVQARIAHILDVEAEANAKAADLLARVLAAAAVGDANTASIISESQTRLQGDQALASDLSAVVVRVGGTEAAVATERTARIDGDSAQATRTDLLIVQTDSDRAYLLSTTNALISGDAALSTRIDALSATVGSNTAAIISEQQARADGDSAQASRTDALIAQTNSDRAYFLGTTNALADAAGASASQINDLYARSDAGTAVGRFSMQVASGPGGVTARIQALVAATRGGQTYGAGYYIDLLDSGQSRFVVDADAFYITKGGSSVPLLSFDGTTLTIPVLRVTQGIIAPNAASDKIIQTVENFTADGSAGIWREVPGSAVIVDVDSAPGFGITFNVTSDLYAKAVGSNATYVAVDFRIAFAINGNIYNGRAVNSVSIGGGGGVPNINEKSTGRLSSTDFEVLPPGQQRISLHYFYQAGSAECVGRITFSQIKAIVSKR